MVVALRTKELFATRLASFVVLGFLIGTFFFSPGTSAYAPEAIRSYGAFTVMVFFFTSVEALAILIRDRQVFLREISRGSYRITSLVLADFLVSIAYFALLSTVYTLICFWLIGITGASKFFFQVFHMFTVLLAGHAAVLLGAVAIPHFTAAHAVILGLFAIMFLTSGTFITRSQIRDNSPWYLWVHYVSMFRYGNDGFVKNLLEGYASFDCPLSCQSTDCSVSSEFVLTGVYGIDNDLSKWADSACLVAFAVFVHLCYVWCLFRAAKH